MKRRKTNPLLIRLYAVRKEIRYAFLIAAISILAIELIFKNFPAPSQTFFSLGEIYLKICYSILAASIFFFINQHLPKEEKKLKYYRFINNKTLSINREIEFILESLKIPRANGGGYNNINEELIKDACSIINPMTPVFNIQESVSPFNDWYDYFNYKTLKIKELIRDLLLIDESLDTDLVEKLLIIEDVLVHSLYFDKKKWANSDLSTYSGSIYELTVQSRKAFKIMRERYKRFIDEYDERYHKDQSS